MRERWLVTLLGLACGAPTGVATADETATHTTSTTGTGSSGSVQSTSPTSGSGESASATSGSGEATGTNPTTGGGASALLLLDGYLVGVGVTDLRVVEGTIAEVGDLVPEAGDEVVDLEGKWVTPAFIDSHVHLLYLNQPLLLAGGGVAAGVDMAAPTAIFEADLSPMRVLAAGPMVTAIGGYPTQSWGADGYGLECGDMAAAIAAVELLHDLGAQLIKLPVMSAPPQLDDATMAAVAARAHDFGLPVATHAMTDDAAKRAALAGADVLAHTPTEPLTDETIALWADRTVVSTVRAFGGSPAAIDNLKRLREAGAQVLYGTDFGNSSVLGVDPDELAAMVAAGMTPEEAIAAGTSAPAAFWSDLGAPLGALTVGKDASLIVLFADPLVDLTTFSSPSRVYVRGVRVDPG